MTARDGAIGAKALASCLYNRRERDARAMLLADAKSDEEKASKRLMGDVACMDLVVSNDMVVERRVSYPHDILRGMLAERALQIAHREVAALPALPIQQIYERKWFAVTGRDVSVDEMGACIADTNPAGIAAVAETEPMSKEEGAAIASLAPSLGKCLRVGTRLEANRQSLRAALADALYQRLTRPPELVAPQDEPDKANE